MSVKSQKFEKITALKENYYDTSVGGKDINVTTMFPT